MSGAWNIRIWNSESDAYEARVWPNETDARIDAIGFITRGARRVEVYPACKEMTQRHRTDIPNVARAQEKF